MNLNWKKDIYGNFETVYHDKGRHFQLRINKFGDYNCFETFNPYLGKSTVLIFKGKENDPQLCQFYCASKLDKYLKGLPVDDEFKKEEISEPIFKGLIKGLTYEVKDGLLYIEDPEADEIRYSKNAVTIKNRTKTKIYKEPIPVPEYSINVTSFKKKEDEYVINSRIFIINRMKRLE